MCIRDRLLVRSAVGLVHTFMVQAWRTPAATAATEPRPSMLDATVGERRRTINLLSQTSDQGDFDRLEDMGIYNRGCHLWAVICGLLQAHRMTM